MGTIGVLLSIAVTLFSFVMNDYPYGRDKTDGAGHVLVKEWAAQRSFEEKDLPQSSAEALENIISIASERRLDWDFYDAWCRYYDVRVSRSWKERENVEKEFSQAVEAYGAPIVTYCHKVSRGRMNASEAMDFLRRNAVALKSSRSEAFYRNRGNVHGMLSGQLYKYIRNDYEYILWETAGFALGRDDVKETAAYKELERLVGGSYPAGAYLEFRSAQRWSDSPESVAGLEKVADAYRGKAVGLLAEAELLRIRKRNIDKNDARTEGDYAALYQDCRRFESARKSMRGEERSMVKDEDMVLGIINDLTSKRIDVSISGDVLKVRLQNLSSATLEIYPSGVRKKRVFKETLKVGNPRFYVGDTVEVALPKMDDGEYVVLAKKGKVATSMTLVRRRLSVSLRLSTAREAIYVADSWTGEPLKKVTVSLYCGPDEVVTVTDYPLNDGFTALPSEIAHSRTKKDAIYSIICTSRDSDGMLLAADKVRLRRYDDYPADDSGVFCKVLTDRGAYNPGDKVFYKGIFYSGKMSERIAVYGDGRTAEASLHDSEGNELASGKLVVNEFGSVAGEFTIPENIRGGTFSVEVSCDDCDGERYITVDEFVAPTFELNFDPQEGLCFPGDEILVRGKAVSYTGHGMTGTRLSYMVLKGDTVFAEGVVHPAADGGFGIAFTSDPEDRHFAHYTVVVTAVTATGETMEYDTWVQVSDKVRLSAVLAGGGVDADARIAGDSHRWRRLDIVDGSSFGFRFDVLSNDGRKLQGDVEYQLLAKDSTVLASGRVKSGSVVDFDASEGYEFVVKARAYAGDTVTEFIENKVYRVPQDASVLNVPFEYYFRPGRPELETGEDVRAMFACADGPVWAVVELTGEHGYMLESRALYLADSSVEEISFEYKKEYPDAVWLNVFYFRNGGAVHLEREFRRVRTTLDLPLTFETFEDRTVPGTEYTFRIRTGGGVECLAAVYDKSLDAFRGNEWYPVRLADFSVPQPEYASWCGETRLLHVIGYGDRMYGARMRKSAGQAVMYDMAEAEEAPMAMMAGSGNSLDEVVGMAYGVNTGSREEAVMDDGAAEALEKAFARSEFASTLAFEPFLRSDADGAVSLKFRTSDKLGTYYVALFAHDRDMKNATLRREMVVTVPVKVDILQPEFLYAGDRCMLSVSVSNNTSADVSGTLAVSVTGDVYKDGAARPKSYRITVPAGGELSNAVDVKVPVRAGEMTVKAVFTADGGVSDGVQVAVPVLGDVQVLTEAHSALLLPEMSKDEVLAGLRKEFVNVSSYGAEYSARHIADMVREMLVLRKEASGADALSLSEAYYVRRVLASLGAEIGVNEPDAGLLERIMACRNADGGFGWFEGMDSNPQITMLVLERLSRVDASLRDVSARGSWVYDAVKYLDDMQFRVSRPVWCGGLSDERYMFVRSRFAKVPFSVTPVSGHEKAFNERMKAFREYAASYLLPKEGRALAGGLSAKVTRLSTLDNLLSCDEGLALSKAWGVSGVSRKLSASVAADVASLLEYAVEHPSGGVYYPDLVMPFRGLLESEARDHAMLADLMAAHGGEDARCAGVADGIRLWLMVQKETQKWEQTPAFVDAVASVLEASDKVMGASVIVLSKSYEKPLSGVKASGNGMTVERRFFRQVVGAADGGDGSDGGAAGSDGRWADGGDAGGSDGRRVDGGDADGSDGSRTGGGDADGSAGSRVDGSAGGRAKVFEEEIQPGTMLNVGDRIRVEYRIWNEENRSFVRLTAPHEASLRPVEQLSGYYGWGVSPLRMGGWYMLRMSGYRDVRSTCTYYYFDSFPEEKTVISEEFFVTHAGEFSAPVVQIESLYAPHYRANAASSAKLKSGVIL